MNGINDTPLCWPIKQVYDKIICNTCWSSVCTLCLIEPDHYVHHVFIKTFRENCWFQQGSPSSSVSNLAWLKSPIISRYGPLVFSCSFLLLFCQLEFKHDRAARRAVPSPAAGAAWPDKIPHRGWLLAPPTGWRHCQQQPIIDHVFMGQDVRHQVIGRQMSRYFWEYKSFF